MSTTVCSVEGCDKKIMSRGWCSAHYNRWRTFGDPLYGGPVRSWSGSDEVCLADGCETLVRNDGGAKGMCKTHYRIYYLENSAPCQVPGCERPTQAKGWCGAHYGRWLSHGDPLGGRRYTPGAICEVVGCGQPYKAQGYCLKHYERWCNTGDPLGANKFKNKGELCAIEGCGKDAYSLLLCRSHYARLKTHGDPLGGKTRYNFPEENGTKQCSQCLGVKPVDEYWTYKSGKLKGQLYTKCNGCRLRVAAKRRQRNIAEPIVMDGEMTCVVCGATKSVGEFRPSNGDKGGRSSRCRDCSRVYHLEYRTKNRDRLAIQADMKRYNISEERVIELRAVERCEICGERPEPEKKLNIDHDHACCSGQFSCGKCVRGMLCQRCNKGIAFLRDSLTLLRVGMSYLEGHRATDIYA